MKKKTLSFILFLTFFVLTLSAQKEITVEDIWINYKFAPRGVPGFDNMNSGDFYSVITRNGIEKHSFETGEKVGNIFTARDLQQATLNRVKFDDIDDYQFDKNETKLLLATKLESIYRRSSKAYYYVYDLTTKEIVLLADTTLGKQSFATFSSDGTKVAFVRDNNIFLKDLTTGKEHTVTTDGSINHVINGMGDWVYEEELSLAKAFEWSGDGTKLAYMRFDESKVKEFSMTYYGQLYPEDYTYKYPKAGEDNSLVDIFIYDIQTATTVKLDLGDNSNCYFPRIYWLPNAADLIVMKLNRHQNKMELIRYNLQTKKMDVVFTDENKCWVEVEDDNLIFLDDSKSMLAASERDGYRHIYKIDFGGVITQITKGDWEVAEICGIDKKKKLIYYLSNEAAMLNQDLYVINFDGKKKKMITDGKGWNSVSFNPTMNYYLNVYSDIATPPIYSIRKNDGKMVRELQNNERLNKTIKEYAFVNKELFSFTTDQGVALNGWMIKPVNFDEKKQYPVLMFVYGGPGSQQVRNSWMGSYDMAWYQLLARKGYMVVCVDGRGTAGRGDAFKKSVYKQMGKLEAEDQLATARYLGALPYVDAKRIGIWGWSFGGYLSSLAMFKGEGLFKMAMAVAPVTNWRYYDNIYTERFLQTPQENPSGYDDNSPIFHADKLQGSYLLVHGMTDDNVHFQNAADLTTALIENNKHFDHFFYPNMNHFINGGNARYHLYVKLTKFVMENL
ncbi:S9 family peptidase [Bacteroidales bacterium OttesenSCG-928-B11]|nr:S9 family peptidase [Bacteroidales bacterium OttesenSCG-928-C03]MDL2311787.1 S9 family peptidase [Bacteroidales bacterium OttesenSCG-928-B11]MDL2326208.1 S9 family peptidase [Bacteroidales bacterium OttesenSCG-928-A14]